MTARAKWSREELEAARRRVRSALEEAPLQPISLGFRGPEAAAHALPPPADLPAGPALRAAAVMSRFRLDDVGTSDPAEMDRLKEQSIPLREEGWRTLEPAVRNAVLRQISREELRLLLEQHPRSDDPLQAALQKARRVLRPDLLQGMSVGELAALLQIHDSAILPAIPRDLIERKLQLARLLEPLRQITRTFSGRAAEMQQLRDYVGVLSTGSWLGDAKRAVGDFLFKPVPKGPFLIHGPGGVGKTTLTAQFILEHALAAENQQFPFAYLDFDRPTVNAEEPVTILIEAVRQIGLQYDSAFAASERLGERWRARLASSADTESFVRDFTGFLETLEVREGPVLFVLDTFEEVQRRSTAYARGVTLLTGRLSIMIPRLRVVIAGRSAPDDGTRLDGQLALEGFDRESAVAYLRNRGLDPEAAGRVADLTRGNPLTLTLAIDLYRRDPAGLRQLDAARLTDEIIQSFLFDRILLHIPDPEVRRLAHPGLVLRRVTPELIRDVLAGPCDVNVPSLQRAEELFEKLASDSTLVTRVDPRTIIHRADVRRSMLKPLREDQSEKVEEIHRAAIAFHQRFPDVISQAEVAYHMLSLGEIARLMPSLEPLLVNALDELAPAAQVQLAEAYDLELKEETWRTADQESWERATARKVAELLKAGDVRRALTLLAERSERDAHTELMIVEAQVQLAANAVSAARDIAERGIRAYRNAGNSALLFRLLLITVEIERRANAFAGAAAYLDDAEEIARRRNDPLMLTQVLIVRAEIQPAGNRAEYQLLLDELVEALDHVRDEGWRRERLLVRKVAARVATTHPKIITRAARLGLLDLPTQEIEALARLENCSPEDLLRRLAEAPSPSLLAVVSSTLSILLDPARDALQAPSVPTKNIKLRSAQREQLRDLLVKHYGGDLGTFLETRYSRGLESVSLSEDVHRNAMDLLRASEREDWLNDLIIGLWRSRFLSLDVLALVDAIDLGPQTRVAKSKDAVPERQLRALLRTYRSGIAALEAQTCRILVSSTQTGCGFLARSNMVATSQMIVGQEPTLEFDRVVLAGRIVDNGMVVGSLRSEPPLRIFFEHRFADEPLDRGRATPDAQPRGVVALPKDPQIDPDQPIFWLWREASGTFVSGVRKFAPLSKNRFAIAAEWTPPMVGASCFDAALRVIGNHCGAGPDNPAMAMFRAMSQYDLPPLD